MKPRLLTEDEFSRTFGQPVRRVTGDEEPAVDFWPYFDKIPVEDFQLRDCSTGRVEYVYRDATGVFEHVLVDSDTSNIFMVIVVNRLLRHVHGHYLLNLNEKYGLERNSD